MKGGHVQGNEMGELNQVHDLCGTNAGCVRGGALHQPTRFVGCITEGTKLAPAGSACEGAPRRQH